MKKPFIHLFSCSNGKYLYDVNSDNIFKISDESYQILENGNTYNHQLKYLEEIGFLREDKVKLTEHPAGAVLSEFYENQLHGLTLQVTQNCNLRCDYCVYSGKYNMRTHSDKTMNLEMAQAGIDYLFEHSKKINTLRIGFYGGEPLLEFDLIKCCVEYIEQKSSDKNINFYITTNATLLTPSVIDFLVQNNFQITISFDGPKEIHDNQRRYADSGMGSFDTVVKRLEYLHQKYHEYYIEKVNINMVLNQGYKYKSISDFMKKEKIFREVSITSTLISNTGVKEENKVSDTFQTEYYYEYFKLLLFALGRIEKKYISPLMRTELRTLQSIRGGKHQQGVNKLPEKWHHGGPCIPGERTIFLNSDGFIYPCERVCELSSETNIGDIKEGIDIDKARNILNIEKITCSICKECWAYRYCDFCIRMAGAEKKNTEKNIKNSCKTMRSVTENLFKDYCVLKELGYDFVTEYVMGFV